MNELSERKLYWLASYPKSGNTWVRMFLDVYVTGFPVNFNSAYRYVNLDHDLGMLQLASAQPVNDLTIEQQFMYQPAAMLNMLRCAKTKDMVVKTHNARITVSGIPLIPEPLTAGAIYVVRDPRDVAVSYAAHLGRGIEETITLMNNQSHAATSSVNRLIHLMSSWSTHVISWVQCKAFPVAVVRYEDLLQQPEAMFRNVLKLLGIEPIDETLFKFALEQTTFERLSKLEDEQGFIERSPSSKEKFFRVGKTRQWQTKLLSSQADSIFNHHATAMKEVGYIV